MLDSYGEHVGNHHREQGEVDPPKVGTGGRVAIKNFPGHALRPAVSRPGFPKVL